MAPSYRSSSQTHSSQGKKQQSISNFFTPKPTQTSAQPSIPKTSSLSRAETEKESENDKENDLFLSSDEEAPVQPRRASQKSKRVLDNGEGEYAENPPAPKKSRKNGGNDREFEDPNQGDVRTQDGLVLQNHASSKSQRPATKNDDHQIPSIHPRTLRYIFSSSSIPGQVEGELDNDETKQKKEQLHQRFVKKLGRPDSIADIKRKNHFITEDAADGEDVEDEEVDEEPASKPLKGRKATSTKKTSTKLTPMEKQVLEIKNKHMDTLLVVEVGYKFRFFGEDARTASKELGIVCIPGKYRYDEHLSEAHIDRFASASIPVHRLHVHVKRLVAAGYKVGVVRQVETAALKAVGDNRNGPFVRKLTNLYTKGTYIDDVEGLEGPSPGTNSTVPSSGYILCLTETNAKGWGNDEKVQVGIVAVQPATGDIIYDDFEDGFMRGETETRLLHIAPCEFLIVGCLSKATDKLMKNLSASKSNVFGDQARVEKVEKPKSMAAQSYSHISQFYAEKMKSTSNHQESQDHVLDKVHQLSEHVTICLSALITHMTEYGLEHIFDLTRYFQPFSARSHMLLNGNTLSSLEIYQNQTDYTAKGSLFWTLDRTRTRFGHRLLRKWVGRPLLDKPKLEERTSSVEELRDIERTVAVEKLKHLLSDIKIDLEKSLIRIYYGKCTRPEFLSVLQALQKISNAYAHIESPSDAGFRSRSLNEAIASLPRISNFVISYLERLNAQAAREDDKYNFLRDDHETDDITEHKLGIAAVEHDLDAHRMLAAEKLKKKKVDYVTVAGIEFLVEVDNNYLKNVPASWAKISGTKKVSRFHTPEVVKMIRERDQHKEALAAACDNAFKDLLAEVATKYQELRDCIQSLAMLDCLLSLTEISLQPGYVKPKFTAEATISVKGGRHPMVEQLLLDTYVPNDINLSSDKTRALLITGPNMGGKSSYVRSVALIAIMGQIGSYVPAESAELGILDAVFTRMGAFDNMMKGESTFMVELNETSDILKQATPRSLVILDELGRGTSTHDGVAIAEAVLMHMVTDVKALTLFITHYQDLSKIAERFRQESSPVLKNVHMRFTEQQEEGIGKGQITFLYEVGDGVAHRSYGLNVAKLANLPKLVLEVAAVKSRELEESVLRRKLGRMVQFAGRLVDTNASDLLDILVKGMEQL
ncbi:hypothetical protein M501DRAFT_993400 [Patellaria atrata CBS 101060]|uniref:DNA mismatch repair protein n=1 Tax=Patellaria atrata CBS 101060 TaxID=1346257 RepID=A0A9P4SHM4_9PEZI|nr:hypothetical protein M501DRAFT_993400 [Patellaria atrata CBS 101060]